MLVELLQGLLARLEIPHRFLDPGAFLIQVRRGEGPLQRAQLRLVPGNVGFQLFRSVRLFGGYSFLWWTNVVRPGDQLNNSIDSRQIPTNGDFVPGFVGTSPGRSFTTTDFWAQGYSFGVLIGF